MCMQEGHIKLFAPSSFFALEELLFHQFPRAVSQHSSQSCLLQQDSSLKSSYVSMTTSKGIFKMLIEVDKGQSLSILTQNGNAFTAKEFG